MFVCVCFLRTSEIVLIKQVKNVSIFFEHYKLGLFLNTFLILIRFIFVTRLGSRELRLNMLYVNQLTKWWWWKNIQVASLVANLQVSQGGHRFHLPLDGQHFNLKWSYLGWQNWLHSSQAQCEMRILFSLALKRLPSYQWSAFSSLPNQSLC